MAVEQISTLDVRTGMCGRDEHNRFMAYDLIVVHNMTDKFTGQRTPLEEVEWLVGLDSGQSLLMYLRTYKRLLYSCYTVRGKKTSQKLRTMSAVKYGVYKRSGWHVFRRGWTLCPLHLYLALSERASSSRNKSTYREKNAMSNTYVGVQESSLPCVNHRHQCYHDYHARINIWLF